MKIPIVLRGALLIFGILVLIFASFYKLTEAPAIWYDEGFYSQIAINFAEHGKQLIQTAPGNFVATTYITVGYPLILPIALSYKLFGIGVLQGRAVMVIFIFGLAAVSYMLTRRLFGAWSGAWTLLLLSTFPMLYGNGKSILGEVPGLFYVVLTLFCLRKLEESEYRDWRWYALLGAAGGLCAATKPLFLLLIAALFITLILYWKRIQLNWHGVLAGFITLMAALLLWVTLQFGAHASVAEVLADYANPYATANLSALVLSNTLRFVKESTPFYTLIVMGIWSVALFARRKKKAVSSAETAAFLFCVLTILSYLRLEGWYRYLFPATILSLLFLPSSCRAIADTITEKMLRLRYLQTLMYGCLFLLAAGQLYQTAHDSYVAQYYQSTRTKVSFDTLHVLPNNAEILLYNVPELAVFLPTDRYYQYLSPIPLVHLGEENLKLIEQRRVPMILIQKSAYADNGPLFSRYKITKEFDRYVILEKI